MIYIVFCFQARCEIHISNHFQMCFSQESFQTQQTVLSRQRRDCPSPCRHHSGTTKAIGTTAINTTNRVPRRPWHKVRMFPKGSRRWMGMGIPGSLMAEAEPDENPAPFRRYKCPRARKEVRNPQTLKKMESTPDPREHFKFLEDSNLPRSPQQKQL